MVPIPLLAASNAGEPLVPPDVLFSPLSRTIYESHSAAGPSGLSSSIATPPWSTAQSPSLRANQLNLFDSTVVAVSSVAPVYSLPAASVSGSHFGPPLRSRPYAGPAVTIVNFVPVLFIAVAYFYRKPQGSRPWHLLRLALKAGEPIGGLVGPSACERLPVNLSPCLHL